MDVNQINQIVRSLIEDPNGDYATQEYLQPLLTLEYTDMANEMRLYGPEMDEYVIELPSVPAGTPDLSGYMAENQPLYWLLNPREIEWKLPGTPATSYVDAEGPINKLRDIPIPGIPALDCWSYLHFNIGLSAFSTALDLRLRGEFVFPPLTTNRDVVQLGMNVMPAMAKRIAKLIAIKRGNQQWVTNYGAEAQRSFDLVIQGLVHARQGKYDMRAGRVNSLGRWPNFNISQ